MEGNLRPLRRRSWEILVRDSLEPCPYIEGQVARLPLRLQLRFDPAEFDAKLEQGDRRVGQMLYRPSCPRCDACIGVRIPVADFQRSRSMERVFRRNADLEVRTAAPEPSPSHLALFNRHKLERGLGRDPLDLESYAGWLVRTCTESVEHAFYLRDRLVAVTVLDLGQRSASAVYTYFDPDLDQRSLGTYAVLYGLEWARELRMDYFYLGLWVETNAHLGYKSRFLPQERLIGRQWVRFDR
jgi:arginine-tRNA-protein transferase